MASDAANGVIYYLSSRREREGDLARVRHWPNLKVGYENNDVWVKGLDFAQICTVEIKSLLYKSIYYERDGRLYLLNSLLPERNVPALLWTPIERALQVARPSYNHNFFGVNDHVPIRFTACEQAVEPQAAIVSLNVLGTYVESAPAVRLGCIRWVIIEKDQALLLGKPLLPIPGGSYWLRKDMLLPVGFDFELHILSDVIQRIVNPGRDSWILWNNDGTYCALSKESLQLLSRSSFRLTISEGVNRTMA